MYENYTYEQIKELPLEERKQAWNELHTLYPDNKDLAKHLDIATIAVTNSVKSYVLGEHVGRKSSKNIDKEINTQQTKPEAKEETKPAVITTYTPPKSSFTMTIEKNMSKTEIASSIGGIANILCDDKTYKVKFSIEEE